MEGKMQEKIISILIDIGSNYRYASPKIVVKSGLGKEFHKEPWLVQLETRKKRRIKHWLRSCVFKLSDIDKIAHLNVFPLRSYGILFGMD